MRSLELQLIKDGYERLDYVVHAEAMKHVSIDEYNLMECIKTKINGSENEINWALECSVQKVVTLSTDKAAALINLNGASKLVSDKLFIAANNIRGWNPIKISVVQIFHYKNLFRWYAILNCIFL